MLSSVKYMQVLVDELIKVKVFEEFYNLVFRVVVFESIVVKREEFEGIDFEYMWVIID